MRVFPKAIVLTTKSHFHVKRTYASIRGLVVRTITSGKTRISTIRMHVLEAQIITIHEINVTTNETYISIILSRQHDEKNMTRRI